MNIWFMIVVTVYTCSLNASLLKTNYDHLDPIHGTALLASGWIKNIHQFGHPQEPMVKLVRHLFHVDEQQLLPTKTNNHLGGHLSSHLIAQLLTTLNNQPTKTSLLAILQQTLLYTTRQRNMVNLLLKAHASSTFLPYTTHRLFLAFLCLKDKHSPVAGSMLVDYFSTLLKAAPHACNFDTISHPIVHALYYGDESHTLENSLKYAQNQEELMNVFKNSWASIRDLINMHRHAHPFPPQITEKEIGHLSYPKRPNCVETALLDLVGLLLYNPATKLYETAHLPKTINMHPDAHNIITSLTPATIDSYDAHTSWCAFLWGKPHIFTYRQQEEQYEVAAFCPENILAAINLIFGTTVKTWHEFGAMLSNEQHLCMFESTLIHECTVIKMCRDMLEKQYNAALILHPLHAKLIVANRAELCTLPQDESLLKLALTQCRAQPTNSVCASLLTLTPPSISFDYLDNTIPLPLIHQVVFSADLSTSERIKTLQEAGIIKHLAIDPKLFPQ